ncbi:MAG: hypothetical protein KA313_02775 [Pseudarcicella sp.]|nr:hypothetical protein [Pseudarcicella sp.]
MFNKKFNLIIISTFIFFESKSQSAFAPLNQDYLHLVERYEIKRGKFSEGFHSNVRPFTRQGIVRLVDSILVDPTIKLNYTDRLNLQYLQDDSWEFTQNKIGDSKQHLLKHFYHKKSDAYSISNDDIDLHISPVVDFNAGLVFKGNQKSVSMNSRGLEIRGMVSKKLGFYTYVTDNLGNSPEYVKNYADVYQNNELNLEKRAGMPGEGYVRNLNLVKNPYSVDFFSARAYITFAPIKNMNIQFGHDKNIWGSGFRSMILSDFSAPYLFLKLTTHIGPVQYQNLFCQLATPKYETNNVLFPKKYATFHHVSVNITKRLNIGLSETIIFERKKGDGIDLSYLNPVIFYRYAEGFQGSADNALLGMDMKYNFAKSYSVYGQMNLDELIVKEIFDTKKGYANNKYAAQIGLKCVDFLGIENLDTQLEYDIARPFTFSHNSGSNFTHYNQALAHPFGANFREFNFITRYQPNYKLQLVARITSTNTGEDRNVNENWGSNLQKSYLKRSGDFGYFIGTGRSTYINTFDLRASYQFRHNLFFDARFINRDYLSAKRSLNYTNTILSLGARMNIGYRDNAF